METTVQRRYDLRFAGVLGKQHMTKDSERGLRALSRQSYEILQKSEALTYQGVANRIIE